MYYQITDVLAYYNIKRAFKKYGIEGTEQKIKEVYANMPTIRDHMLKNYCAIIERKLK